MKHNNHVYDLAERLFFRQHYTSPYRQFESSLYDERAHKLIELCGYDPDDLLSDSYEGLYPKKRSKYFFETIRPGEIVDYIALNSIERKKYYDSFVKFKRANNLKDIDWGIRGRRIGERAYTVFRVFHRLKGVDLKLMP